MGRGIFHEHWPYLLLRIFHILRPGIFLECLIRLASHLCSDLCELHISLPILVILWCRRTRAALEMLAQLQDTAHTPSTLLPTGRWDASSGDAPSKKQKNGNDNEK